MMLYFIQMFLNQLLMINLKDNGQSNQIHQKNMLIKYIFKITIRSLLWIGYVAYNTVNTKIFGGVYIGKGIKNCDLCL